MRFNTLMAKKVAQAIQSAEFDVVKSYFPTVTGSNYSSMLMSEAEVEPDLNGHPQYGHAIVGTANTWPFYGWMNQLQNWIMPGLSKAYGVDPFRVLRWHIKVARAMRRSAPRCRFAHGSVTNRGRPTQ